MHVPGQYRGALLMIADTPLVSAFLCQRSHSSLRWPGCVPNEHVAQSIV